MSFRIAHAGIAALCLALATPSQAAPRDVMLVEEARESDGTSTSITRKTLVDEALSRVDELARERGYPRAFFNSGNPLISDLIERMVRTELPSSHATKKQRVVATLRAVNGTYAEAAMAEAASFSAPSLKLARVANLSSSVRVSGGGAIQASLELSSIRDERGTTGQGNGILDPGEAATLTLAFTNRSSKRLASTSLYPKSTSDCLWIEEKLEERESREEYELDELMPGQATTISFDVYRSRLCPGIVPTLDIIARDSYQFPSGIHITYRFGGPGTQVDTSKLVDFGMGGDDPGHSEPTETRPLQPDSEVEMVSGLQIPGSLTAEVVQQFSIPSILKSEHTPGPVQLRARGSNSVASFFDDIDITVPRSDSLQQYLDPIALAQGWKSRSDAHILVAVDSAIRPGAPRDENGEAFLSYQVRHYLALPVSWSVEAKCSLAISTKRVTSGNPVSVGGWVSGVPASAIVSITGPSGTVFEPDIEDDLSFSRSVSTASLAPGRHHFTLNVLSDEGDRLCEAAASFVISGPECSLSVSSRDHGDEVVLTGSVAAIPESAIVAVIDPEGTASEPTLNADLTFTHRVSTASLAPGTHEFKLKVLSEEGDILCEATARATPRAAPRAAQCSVTATPSLVKLGETVNLKGSTGGLPSNSTVSVVITTSDRAAEKVYKYNPRPNSSYNKVFRPLTPGTHTITVQAFDTKRDLLCKQVANFEVRQPEVEHWPRTYSLEPGFIGQTGAISGVGGGIQVGFSAGGAIRVVARGSVVQGDVGFGIGVRLTGAVLFEGEDAVVEPSFQVLRGKDSYYGDFYEFAATLAIHGKIGPFLTIGGLVANGDLYPSYVGGLGFYFE